MAHHAFLSYSRQDLNTMMRVRDSLRDGGLTIWTDENLEPGTENWKDAIQEALESSRTIVVILSPDSKKSQWVKRELDYASALNLRIFPVLARGNARESVPLLLVSAQYADITRDFEKGIRQLRHAIHSFVGVPLPAPALPPAPAPSPAPSSPDHPKYSEPKTPESPIKPAGIVSPTSVAAPPSLTESAALLADQQLVLAPASGFLLSLKRFAPLALLVVMTLIFSVANPNFLGESVIRNMMSNAATTGLMAVGMSYVVLSGGIDLSVGAVMGLAAFLAVMVDNSGGGFVGALLTALGVGVLVGGIQGYFILRMRMASGIQLETQPGTASLGPALLVTLVGLYLINSVALIISEGALMRITDEAITGWQVARIAGVPISFILFLVVAAAAWALFQFTSLGQQIILVRTDRQAARRQGIRVNTIVVGGYVATGLMAGLAGFVTISRIGVANPSLGSGTELSVIAAVIVGGTSLFSPQGSVLRSVVGVFIITILPFGLILLGASSYWQRLSVVVVLVFFVVLDFLTMPRPTLIRTEQGGRR